MMIINDIIDENQAPGSVRLRNPRAPSEQAQEERNENKCRRIRTGADAGLVARGTRRPPETPHGGLRGQEPRPRYLFDLNYLTARMTRTREGGRAHDSPGPRPGAEPGRRTRRPAGGHPGRRRARAPGQCGTSVTVPAGRPEPA